MSVDSLHRRILLHAVLLGAVVMLFDLSDLDRRIQDRFYNWGTHRWLVDRHEPVARAIFYHGAKGLVIAVGVSGAVVWLLSWRLGRLRRFRRPAALVALATILIPLTVAGLKLATKVYTPLQSYRYGGSHVYRRPLQMLDPVDGTGKPGKGFPAGHASGGFALIALQGAFLRRRWRAAGLAAGMMLGWAMGLYQTFNGQHYLSHTLVTMSLACMMTLGLRKYLDPLVERSNQPAPAPGLFRPADAGVAGHA